MRKILTVVLSATLFLFVGSASADEHGDDRTWAPVEAFACNFKDGKGPSDLAAVVEEWNAWMDDEDQTEYFAITLWPSYYGEQAFDVLAGLVARWPCHGQRRRLLAAKRPGNGRQILRSPRLHGAHQLCGHGAQGPGR